MQWCSITNYRISYQANCPYSPLSSWIMLHFIKQPLAEKSSIIRVIVCFICLLIHPIEQDFAIIKKHGTMRRNN